jgi:hypothetical protein
VANVQDTRLRWTRRADHVAREDHASVPKVDLDIGVFHLDLARLELHPGDAIAHNVNYDQTIGRRSGSSCCGSSR